MLNNKSRNPNEKKQPEATKTVKRRGHGGRQEEITAQADKPSKDVPGEMGRREGQRSLS